MEPSRPSTMDAAGSDLNRVSLAKGCLSPTLDPSSPDFSPHAWFTAVETIKQSNPSVYASKSLGLSFRNLSAYGFRTNDDYQATFATFPMVPFRALSTLCSPTRRKTKVQILNSMDGLIRSGELLLVLGRPGSGCTTLLKSLSGDHYGFSLTKDSSINYQGIPAQTMHNEFRGDCVYTAENDVHFPELTVEETLDFAVRTRMSRVPFPGRSHDEQAQHFREVLLRLFKLQSARSTKLGNELIRGVSGGERKRTSIAEAMAGWSAFQCWDNSTRGLDSATALDFVRTMRLMASTSGSSSVMSVYQASEAMYQEFDKVSVLYEGQQIFFGRCDEAKAYFSELGFWCPANVTTPDFLTSLTQPVEAKSLVRPGWEDRVPRSSDDFRQAWLNSQHWLRLLQHIEEYEQEFPCGGESLAAFRRARAIEKSPSLTSRSHYTISVGSQLSICVTRGIQRLKNNWSAPLANVIGNTIMGIIVGSIFFNLDETTNSFYNRSVLIFFATLLNAFMSSFEVLAMWAQRPIVEKQSQYAFYHPCVEAVASIIGDFPSKVITSILFNVAIYFLTNLRRSVSAFFTFWVFGFVCLVTMSMFFRMVGSLSRTVAQTMAPVAIFLVNYIIYTGFVLPPEYMRPWLSWVRHIDPVAYAFESLMLNEFSGREYPCGTFVPDGPGYSQVGNSGRICSAVGASTGSSSVQGDRHILLSYSFGRSHLWRNMGILVAMMIFFCTVHLIAAEYIRPQRSKGEVLLFRRGNAPGRKPSDEESTDFTHTEKPKDELTNQAFVPSGIQRENAVVHWKNLNFDIKTKEGHKRLLTEVNGWVKPGTLTALMGVSGAGKTTLLDVLADRVTTGVVGGDIMVNGQSRGNSFQRKTGYVQQLDLHLPTATVRETLQFNAFLRQPKSTPRSEKLQYVEEVLKALDMEPYANAVVGKAGESLNVEQRKRLTIAVEMAAKPDLLLFLDEPTSGLDSQTAWSICMLLRKLVSYGQAIMCTIHQPSAVLLAMFDQLLLLEQPGRTVYFGPLGPNCEDMVRYFETNGARPKALGENPADWVLDITTKQGKDVENWADVWNASPEKSALKEELNRIEHTTIPLDISTSSGEYAAPFMSQVREVTKRIFVENWRSPIYLWCTLILCFGTAFFIGFSFWDSPNSIQGLRNQIFSIFLILTIFSNIQQLLIPRFVDRRALYEAVEQRAKTYSWKVFVLSNIVVELPSQFFISITLFLIWYYPVGMADNARGPDSNERGALMFLCLWVYMTFCSSFSAMLAAGIEHAQTGVEIAQLLYYLILIFCGILVRAADLPRFWIFMYRVSPLTYLSSAMMSAGVANNPVACSAIEVLRVSPPSGQSCEQYLSAYRNYTGATLLPMDADGKCGICPISQTNTFLDSVDVIYGDRWRYLGIAVVYVVINILGTFGIFWLARVPKGKGSGKGKAGGK